MARLRRMVACALALGIWLFALNGQARVRVCVRVEGGNADVSELSRLVMTEVNRHTTHQAVTADCDSNLSVELVRVSGERYLTARLDTEVPHREQITSAGTARAVERLLTVVFHNAPKRLYGPERDDWIGRARAAFLLHGTSYFGLELYQVSALVGGRLQALPGAALSARREVDRVHVGLRIGGASVIDTARADIRLSQQIVAQLELALFTSSESDAAWFLAGTAGIEYQRYELMVAVAPERRVESVVVTGFSFGLRGGLELLRTSHVRFQFFGQLLAPAFVAKDASETLLDQWTPTAALGMGAHF